MGAGLAEHVEPVLKAIMDGRLVPFLGAGVNRCGRPDNATWETGRYLPDGRELAEKLAQDFGFDLQSGEDLLRVSERVAVTAGTGPLRDSLHEIFATDYPGTSAHRFLAGLPKILRAFGRSQAAQLIITTNYDDLLECAFRDAGEPLDVLKYFAEGAFQGRFVHLKAGGKESTAIDKPNEYMGLPIDPSSNALKSSLLVKVHGAVNRTDKDQDSYVITEDHYIDYLSRSNLRNLVPKTLVAKLKGCHFLFLGYGLRDWNMRALLWQIWGEQKFNYRSWAIQRSPDRLDQKFWSQRDVEIIDARLEEFIELLGQRVSQRAASSVGTGATAANRPREQS